MEKKRKSIRISLEDCVNGLVDRHHLSKEQGEKIYREWGKLKDTDTILYNITGVKIVGFKPLESIESVDLKIIIDPKTGDVETFAPKIEPVENDQIV